ncbi:hypothetical protein [Arthrobacter sp. UYCo732]|uniref:hypothetical protein n=1 Tax=Arthrobacter sp. UYCo732 TaxID=3156336 RepID=UPI0033999F30
MATSAGTFVVVGTLRDAGYSDSNSIAYLKPGQGAVVSREQSLSAPSSLSPAPAATAAAIKSTLYYRVLLAPGTAWPGTAGPEYRLGAAAAESVTWLGLFHWQRQAYRGRREVRH